MARFWDVAIGVRELVIHTRLRFSLKVILDDSTHKFKLKIPFQMESSHPRKMI
jgi:hypothetical protein